MMVAGSLILLDTMTGTAPQGSALAEEIDATVQGAREPQQVSDRLSGDHVTHDREPDSGVRASSLGFYRQHKHWLFDAARDMGVTEAEPLAAWCGERAAVSTRRLTGDWASLIETLPVLGPVKTVTSNGCVLLEVEGGFEDVELSPPTGRAIGRAESRFSFDRWRFGFSTCEQRERTVRSSVRFFDRFGTSIHQVELVRGSHPPDFDSFLGDWTSEDQSPRIVVERAPPRPPERADHTVDVLGLRRAWTTMLGDLHETDSFLHHLQLSDVQALRLAGPEIAFPIPRETVREVFASCRDYTLPITLLVGNHGMTQRCVSTLRAVSHAASQLTLRGAGCELHIREDLVESAWIVRRPSKQGMAARLELYGRDGRQAAVVCGGPDHRARVAWAILIGSFAAGSD
jgi:putative hemin transport protein